MVDLAELAIRLRKYRYIIFNALVWILFGTVYASLYLIFIGISLYILQLNLGSMFREVAELFPIIPLIVAVVAFAKISKVLNIEHFKGEGKIFAIVFTSYFIAVYTVLSVIFGVINLWSTKLGILIGSYIFSTVWYPTLGLCFITIYLSIRKVIRSRGWTYPNDFKLAGIIVLGTSPLIYIILIRFLIWHKNISINLLYYIPLAGGSIATGMMLCVYACVTVTILISAVRALYVKEEQQD